MIMSADGSAFKLKPGVFHFRKGDSANSAGKTDVALSVVFQKPHKTDEADENIAFATGTILFENVRENTFYGPNELSGIETAWLPVRPLSAGEVKVIESSTVGKVHSPFSVFMSLTETTEPSKFIQILTGAIEDNIEPIKSEAKQVIIDLTGLSTDKENSQEQ